MKRTCHSLEQLTQTAKKFIEELARRERGVQATVIGLSGDLGTGKTTFTKAVAQELGVAEVVTSPTFVIQKRYTLAQGALYKQMIHIDAYRLEKGNDLLVLDWNNLVADPDTLICIEWPEQVRDALPVELTVVTFKHIDETTRQIEW